MPAAEDLSDCHVASQATVQTGYNTDIYFQANHTHTCIQMKGLVDRGPLVENRVRNYRHYNRIRGTSSAQLETDSPTVRVRCDGACESVLVANFSS